MSGASLLVTNLDASKHPAKKKGRAASRVRDSESLAISVIYNKPTALGCVGGAYQNNQFGCATHGGHKEGRRRKGTADAAAMSLLWGANCSLNPMPRNKYIMRGREIALDASRHSMGSKTERH